jgi:hypothetical protein
MNLTYKGKTIAWTEGYLYGSHWEGLSAAFKAKAAIATKYSPAGSAISLLPVVQLNQSDNKDWGDDGTASNLRYGGVQCGLTSVSMALSCIWPNAKVKQLAGEAGGQFEDWVAGQFKKIGAQSTSMEGHVAVLKHLGIKSIARRDASISDLKQALQALPVVLGLAYKASGHFTCGVGVADKAGDLPEKWMIGSVDTMLAYPQDAGNAGVLINDPYGQRDYSGSGNQWINIANAKTDSFGLHNVLTTSTLERFWVDGGEESGWAVFLDPATPNAGNDADSPVVLGQAPPSPATALSTVTAVQNTLFKRNPVDSGTLKPEEKVAFAKDSVVKGVLGKAAGGHISITLAEGKTPGLWYLFEKHCKVETPGGISVSSPGGAITEDDYIRIAKMIGCTPRALKTVIQVEAAGSGLFPNGKAKILFEAHWFGDFTNYAYNQSHPDISSKGWNRDLYIGGEREWERLEKAMKINRAYAIGSASWGLGQVMGAYSWEMPAMEIPGATDAEKAENFMKLNETESGQLEIMGRFIMADERLKKALINLQWANFAYAYNGESYAVNQYDIKLADAYASLG